MLDTVMLPTRLAGLSEEETGGDTRYICLLHDRSIEERKFGLSLFGPLFDSDYFVLRYVKVACTCSRVHKDIPRFDSSLLSWAGGA